MAQAVRLHVDVVALEAHHGVLVVEGEPARRRIHAGVDVLWLHDPGGGGRELKIRQFNFELTLNMV